MMNFLAHLFLSCGHEDLLIGNLIADFIRNRELTNYSPAVQRGIWLHRQIDQFTDQHPMVRQGTRRLQPNHRKYAPVVVDIFYDHLLAKNWTRYYPDPLPIFIERTYAVLTRRMEEMPPRLKKQLPDMIAANWLQQYANQAGMQYVFERMDLRTSFPSNFYSAMEDLNQDFAAFNAEFNHFFPEVIDFVRSTNKQKEVAKTD